MSNEETSLYTNADLSEALSRFAGTRYGYNSLRIIPLALIWVMAQDSGRISAVVRRVLTVDRQQQLEELCLLKQDLREKVLAIQQAHDWGTYGIDKLLDFRYWEIQTPENEVEIDIIRSEYWAKIKALLDEESRVASDFDRSDERCIIATARPSSTVPGKVAYKTSPDATKYTVTSYTKWLRRAINVLPCLTLSDGEIQVLQDYLQGYFQPLDDMYQFKIVQGQDLLDVYREKYFGSCMHSSPGPRLYRDNPDNVKMLTARDDDGELVARALVWHTDEGYTVLDRIYPSDGGIHTKAMRQYAIKHGWYYKEKDGVGFPVLHPITGEPGRFTVTLHDTGYYPYMDTFLHVRMHGGKKIVVSNTCDYCFHHLQSTDNYGPDGPGRTNHDPSDPLSDVQVAETLSGQPITQRQIDEGQVTWVEYPEEGWVYSSEAVWIREHDYYACVHSSGVVASIDGEWILTNDTEYMYVQIWHRYGADWDWVHPDDVVEGPKGSEIYILHDDLERFCNVEDYVYNDDGEWISLSNPHNGNDGDDSAPEVAETPIPFSHTLPDWEHTIECLARGAVFEAVLELAGAVSGLPYPDRSERG